MTLQELQEQILFVKERKTSCLKGMATASKDKLELYGSLAEALAMVEIRSQVAYMYQLREEQNPNLHF